MQRIGSDQTLSSEEWALASTLAQNENEWARKQEEMRLQSGYDIKKANATTSGAGGLPTMTYEQFRTAMGGGTTTGVPGITESKPTSRLGPMNAVSPGGQWYWDYSSGDWIPLVA